MHTFVFADLAGFTALTEAHGDEHAADAAMTFVDGMREIIAGYSALEVKTMGDAVMLHVGDVEHAVALCADAVATLGLRHGALGVRIGMNTGPAVRRGEDWFGAAVNIAARVCGLARIDEVLLTESTARHASSVLSAERLRDLGPHELRHVSRPVHLYALRQDPAPVGGGRDRDPVCLMGVDEPDAVGVLDGVRYAFCSAACAEVFLRDPDAFRDRVSRRRPAASSRGA